MYMYIGQFLSPRSSLDLVFRLDSSANCRRTLANEFRLPE